MLRELSLTTIREARRRIQPWVLRTPVLHHRLDADCELLLKPESLQSTGAFKIRGAFDLMLTLPKGCAGVVAHSPGNHAQAVARAANLLGLRAVIVMPADAPEPKRARTAADGAELLLIGPDSDERALRADEIARSEGLVPVPPYDHPLVAVEPADGNDTQLSLAAGERRRVPPPGTIADGLRVRSPGVPLSGGNPQPEHLELAARRAVFAPARGRVRFSRP